VISDADRALVTAQLGRPPRDPWRVAVRCCWDRPAVLAAPPVLADGTPFPTTFWLSCPWLVERIGAIESNGGAALWAERLAADQALAAAATAADLDYRAARAAEAARHAPGAGPDRTADVGIAGQRDPLATKCLHAHAAAALAGIGDPVGAAVLREMPAAWCPDDACRRLGVESQP
jgi:hypothetical protein